MPVRSLRLAVTLLVVLCATPQTSLSQDSEPNSTFEAAVPLPLNTEASGTVNGESDPADFYRLEVPVDGELTITVTHQPSDFQFFLYGANEDDNILGTETNLPSPGTRTRTLQAGIFHLQINSRSNPTPIAYTVRADLVAAAPVTDETATNDEPATASPLTLNATQTGHISHTRDDALLDNLDYYQIELPQDATVTFTVSHEPDGFDFQWVLRGQNGVTQIFGTETNFPSGDSRVRSLQAGTYFWEVNGRGSTQGRVYQYRIDADPHPPATQDPEPNDAIESATSLVLNVTEVGHISFTRPDASLDDLDYHLVQIPADGEVTFRTEYDPPREGFQFTLYGDGGAPTILGTETNLPSGGFRTRSLEAGSYVWLVTGRGSILGRSYFHSVQHIPALPFSDEGGPNDGPETADLIDLATTTVGHLSFTRDDGVVDNQDFWSFNLPGPGPVGIQLTLTHTPPGEGFQFRVLNSSLSDIAGTETVAPSPRTLTFTAQPGLHYLIVDGRGSQKGRVYQVSAAFFDPAVGTPTPTPPPTATPTPLPVETPNSIYSDVDNDGFVGPEDLLLFLSDWNKRVLPRDDF